MNRTIIEAAIGGFEEQKRRIDATIAELRSQLGTERKKPGPKAKVADVPPTQKRTMSKAGRDAIRQALKKRWAAYHAGNQAAPNVAPKKPKKKEAKV